MDSNINFDIKKKVNPIIVPKSEFASTVYTDAEQDKLLIGYDPIPEDAIMLLRPGTHVRYMTTAGEFRRGGFVHNVKTKGKPMVFLETGKDPKIAGYKKWPVAIEDIATMWKKRTLEDVKINEIQQHHRPELENRITALETQLEYAVSEIKKMITAICKLNEKIQTKQPMVATMRPVTMRS